MIFQEYPALERLDDEIAAQHAAREREWFGAAPFGDYAICTAPACRRVLTADAVHGRDMTADFVPLHRLEAAMPDGLGACPDCGAPLEPMMPPAAYLAYVRKEIYRGAWGVFGFDENGAVQAATLASIRTLSEAVAALNYRNGYDPDQVAAAVGARMGLSAAAALDMPVLYWNRIGVSVGHRSAGVTAELVRRLHAMRPEPWELPTVGDTYPTTRMYRMLTARGFEILARDHLGGVLTFARRAAAALEPAFREPAAATPVAPRRHYVGFPAAPSLPEPPPVWRVLSGPALDEVAVRRMAALFREVFAGYHGQYLFYPSEMRPLPPDTVFGAGAAPDLEVLDGIDLDALARPGGERPRFWHAPGPTLDNLRAKLCGAGHAVLCYGARGALDGMIFGYPASLRQAFAGEEWQNPVAYSGWTPPRLRDFERFRERLAAVVAAEPALAAVAGGPLGPDSPVFVLNCVAVSPRRRGGGLGAELNRRMVDSLPPALAGRLTLAEIAVDGPLHRHLRQAGAVDVPGALDEGPGAPRLVVAASAAVFRVPD